MAKAKKTDRKSARRRSVGVRKPVGNDAIALLKADHRQVEGWLEAQVDVGSANRRITRADELVQTQGRQPITMSPLAHP